MSVLIGSAADSTGVFVDGAQEAAYVAKVLALSPIAYWVLGEHEGATAFCQVNPAQNGTHTAVTLGNAGIGDGQVCPYYDGAAYTDVYSATLRAALNGNAGTVAIWVRVSAAGDWTDGSRREAVRMIDTDDSNEYFWLAKDSTNNQWWFRYTAAGTIEDVRVASGAPTAFTHLALTWDINAGADGEVKAYAAGAQTGATRTNLGVWAGLIDTALIGAATTAPLVPWKGYLAHCALFNSALAVGSIASLASP
jgi:hypothetical protein